MRGVGHGKIGVRSVGIEYNLGVPGVSAQGHTNAIRSARLDLVVAAVKVHLNPAAGNK